MIMPKMYNKKTALQIIFRAADKIADAMMSKGITEGDISKGELRKIFNIQNKRGKDIFSMALRKFVISNVIRTTDWEMVIVEPDKPRIHFRILRQSNENKAK